MILINAVSARHGGAREILRKALVAASDHPQSSFVIACPRRDDLTKAPNIRYVSLSLAGFSAFLFNIFGVALLAWWVGAKTIISLNNVNTIFSAFERITYFHQLKIFTGPGLRFSLIRKAIQIGGPHRYIVQTPYVQQEFLASFGHGFDVHVCWPGVNAFDFDTENSPSGFLLWVTTDVLAPQKNWPLIADIGRALNTSMGPVDRVVVTAQSPQDGLQHEGVDFVGRQDPSGIASLYRRAAGLVVSSTEETLCLPIFEFLQTGRMVYILDAPYVDGAFYGFSRLPSNVTIFDDVAELVRDVQGGLDVELDPLRYWSLGREVFFDGEWKFLAPRNS